MWAFRGEGAPFGHKEPVCSASVTPAVTMLPVPDMIAPSVNASGQNS